MAKTLSDRSKLLEILRENPYVNLACKKVGISRATFYRWQNGNPEFRAAVKAALEAGNVYLNEIAKAKLADSVKKGEKWAVQFQLSHRDPDYAPKKPIVGVPMTEEEMRYLNLYREKRQIAEEMVNVKKNIAFQKLLDAVIARATNEEREELLRLSTETEDP